MKYRRGRIREGFIWIPYDDSLGLMSSLDPVQRIGNMMRKPWGLFLSFTLVITFLISQSGYASVENESLEVMRDAESQQALVDVQVLETLAYNVVSYTDDNPPETPSLGDLPLQSSITQHGITWTFSEPVPVGQFVNGDTYVVGPVTIVTIDPPPHDGRNGSVLNLPSFNDRTGFDDRVQGNRYDASMRSDPPISMVPGDALVSTISVETIGEIKRVLRPSDDTISPIRTASVLTCLSEPVPPDAFRPSYGDRSQAIFLSRNLRRDFLPNLEAVPSSPLLTEFEGYFQKPWIDANQFGFDFPIEYMPDYGREIGRAVSMASLLLTLDFTPEEKEPLLVYFVQYGIDLHGLVQAGYRGWPAHGGHGSGRKWPIVFAGILFQDQEMQHPDALFGEDMQTMYDNGWTGANVVYAGHVGVNGEQVNPGWGPYEHLQPKDWISQIGESYRRCCTSLSWVGEALAARLLNAEEAWDHPAFFDYVDRWMMEDDSEFVDIIEEQTGVSYHASWARQGQAWDDFVEEMWAAYRFWEGPSPTFEDVPVDHWAYEAIETLYQAGFVSGCSLQPLLFCPENIMTRAESAVFVERGIHGADYLPLQPQDSLFADVPLNEWYAKWSHGLWEDGYTSGCGTDPLIYCPLQQHTRTEGAVFFLRMLNGADYEPPEAQGLFADVNPASWEAKWVEAAYQAGLIDPCETAPELRYCGEDPLSRAIAATIIVRAKGME
jgi:hypothetical protein